MKKFGNECDPSLIDRFFDKELSHDEHTRIMKHLTHCSVCQKRVQDNQAISALFKVSLDKELSQANLDDLEERVVALVRKKEIVWWKKFIDLSLPKKLVIPAAAMATILLFFCLTRNSVPVSAPSAIVKSFSGEVSSVIIIETPKSRQTIVWYTEPS